MLSHEATGDQLVPAQRRNLPNRILRAFDQAMHLKGLPRGARDTLAELCRFVPQNRPFESVFAHKKTIADRIGMSERSLYRHLATLKKHELIDILDQDRKSRNGRFTVARVRLTRLAAALIGLIEAPELFPDVEQAPEAGKEAGQPVSPALSENAPAALQETPQEAANPGALSTVAKAPAGPLQGPVSPVIHTPPSAKMAAGHTLSEPTISKHQPPARTENGVPVDLAWLSSNGVSRAGIFKLMGLAKARAKRLSDIALAVRQRVCDVKGGRLYAYLAKLIAGPSDFSVLAANERKRIEEARVADAYARKARAFRERFRNCSLTNRKQNRLYVIDAKAQFVQVLGGPYPASAPLNDLREWIEHIENGMLILATRCIEQRFQC